MSWLCAALGKPQARSTTLAKDFESFREYVTVKAGFFQMVATPSGLRKVPKSISFAKMDEVDFANLLSPGA